MIDISGLDKAAVLAALYNNSRLQGRGPWAPGASVRDMDIAEAQEVIDTGGLDFDYLRGRVLKVDLAGDTFEEWLYDRDIAHGKAARVIEHLRKTGSVSRIRHS